MKLLFLASSFTRQGYCVGHTGQGAAEAWFANLSCQLCEKYDESKVRGCHRLSLVKVVRQLIFGPTANSDPSFATL